MNRHHESTQSCQEGHNLRSSSHDVSKQARNVAVQQENGEKGLLEFAASCVFVNCVCIRVVINS